MMEQQINESWNKVIFSKLGFTYDIAQFYNSNLYKDCLPDYVALNSESKQHLSHYFLVLSVQIEIKKKLMDDYCSGAVEKIKPTDVTVTENYIINITHYPYLFETWQNMFDNPDIWKKEKSYTKWVVILFIGPFAGPKNAIAFDKVWSNIARGLTTKVNKLCSLAIDYNETLKRYFENVSNIDTFTKVSSPPIKIYVTPYKKEEHFTKIGEKLCTLKKLYGDLAGSSYEPATNWSIDLNNGDVMYNDKEVAFISDLL
jgi:hypothetical protein